MHCQSDFLRSDLLRLNCDLGLSQDFVKLRSMRATPVNIAMIFAIKDHFHLGAVEANQQVENAAAFGSADAVSRVEAGRRKVFIRDTIVIQTSKVLPHLTIFHLGLAQYPKTMKDILSLLA